MTADITADLPSLPSPAPAQFKRPEILAPAGNWECAKAAVENGADAIYFGLDRFNARMRAENFTEADLPDLMTFLHRRGVKGYVTINTLVFPQELPEAAQYLRSMMTAGVDAAIVQDVGICRLIRHLSPDFPIHASTQMTVTTAIGVEFARNLGCELVVLARECSLKEIRKIQQQLGDRQISLPLEVFVHGALCVAYSGQCLTSEALGGRSANRGECAQACRMPYDLIADGELVNLGDRKYLLSPQDLSGLEVLPDLVKAGISSLKIEGRLKAPEYVANVTRTYRQAIDRVMESLAETEPDFYSESDRYSLEMSFSRGLSTGWLKGINNQELVHARFGKKRGVYLGQVAKIRPEQILLTLEAPVKPGDGVVFDNGHPEQKEEGGRIYAVEQRGAETILTFGRNDLNWRRIHPGDRLWKTSDPELDRQLRQTYAGETPRFQRLIDLEVYGELGRSLTVIARDAQAHIVQVESAMPLVAAEKQPLTIDRLREQFGRLGNTPFCLGELVSHLQAELMLPMSELNRLRREIVTQLDQQRTQPRRWHINPQHQLKDLLPNLQSPPPVGDLGGNEDLRSKGDLGGNPTLKLPTLIPLVRRLNQLEAVLQFGSKLIYCELEDPRAYRQAVQIVRNYLTTDNVPPQIFVAPPRITKPGENWILQQVRSSEADGYLVRNYDHLKYFADQRRMGDFSLNVANALTADYWMQFGLERLTASYDLNISQLEDLIRSCLTDWLEVTIHQHMPMFHMEHCVFCAFLSEGTDYTNCGRPCEQSEVKLRDRVGTEHLLQADAGCRNTVFNGTAQTGAEYVQRLIGLGVRSFRLEFVNETPDQVRQTIACYQQLLEGKITGAQLWRKLKLQNRLGVTRGPFDSTQL